MISYKTGPFTYELNDMLKDKYPEHLAWGNIMCSPIIKYIKNKTASLKNAGSKSNISNIYAIYVLVKDYIDFKKGIHPFHVTDFKDEEENFNCYDGLPMTELLSRLKVLPFNEKAQGHAISSRLNSDFTKVNLDCKDLPVLIDHTSKISKYKINPALLKIEVPSIYKYINGVTEISPKHEEDIAETIIKLLEAYIWMKQKFSHDLINYLNETIAIDDEDRSRRVIYSAMNNNAMNFELFTYAIIKHYYKHKDGSELYKTGRLNANDGGIDFIMKPSGRIFQVTEMVNKAKMDADSKKVCRMPMTFVLRSKKNPNIIIQELGNVPWVESIITLPNLWYMILQINPRTVLTTAIAQLKFEMQLDSPSVIALK